MTFCGLSINSRREKFPFLSILDVDCIIGSTQQAMVANSWLLSFHVLGSLCFVMGSMRIIPCPEVSTFSLQVRKSFKSSLHVVRWYNQAGSSALPYRPILSLSTLSATVLEAEGAENPSDHSLTLVMNFVTELHESQRWMNLPSNCDQRATPSLIPWDSILEGDMLVTFCQWHKPETPGKRDPHLMNCLCSTDLYNWPIDELLVHFIDEWLMWEDLVYCEGYHAWLYKKQAEQTMADKLVSGFLLGLCFSSCPQWFPSVTNSYPEV